MKDIVIREATSMDIPVLLGLLYELGRPKPQLDSDVDIFRGLVRQHISDSDKKILVAVIDQVKLVGMASILFLPRLNQNTAELYVPELVIDKRYQNMGIGSKLINSCIDIGKKKKCHRIRLESGNQRNQAHQFYKQLGFLQSAQSFTKVL